jgi:Ca2+-binding EF-hand superfamily protein
MKKMLIVTGCLSLLTFAAHAGGPAAGGGKPAPRKPFGTGELPEILKPFDLDNDGKLNAEEHQAFLKATRDAQKQQQEAFIKKYDTDGDGKLSATELKAARKAAQDKVLELRAKRFKELDKDGDGSLTLEEFAPPVKMSAAQTQAIFNHLDADHDKKITETEFVNGAGMPCPPQTPPTTAPGGTPATGGGQ